MNLDKTVKLIEQWGTKRELVDIKNNDKQLLKTVEEVGELAEAHNKHYPDKVEDSVGDIFVTLVLYCAQRGISITDCVDEAYKTIENREGKTEDGVFIKEQDLRSRRSESNELANNYKQCAKDNDLHKHQKVLLDYFKETIKKTYPIERIPTSLGHIQYNAMADEALSLTTSEEQFEILLEFAKWGLENE